jgi:hypothetical protein
MLSGSPEAARRPGRVERTIYTEADRQQFEDLCEAGVNDPCGCDDPWCEGCGKCGLHHPSTRRSAGCDGFFK